MNACCENSTGTKDTHHVDHDVPRTINTSHTALGSSLVPPLLPWFSSRHPQVVQRGTRDFLIGSKFGPGVTALAVLMSSYEVCWDIHSLAVK